MNIEDVKQLEENIIAALRGIPDAESIGRANSTVAIKRALTDLGCASGYDVCPDDCDPQWLYDLVWYRNDDGRLKRVGLVLESEWDRHWGGIKYDFEKLLVAKAPLKVMVFDGTQEGVPELWELMEGSIRSYEAVPTGERYILAGWDDDTGFAFKTVVA